MRISGSVFRLRANIAIRGDRGGGCDVFKTFAKTDVAMVYWDKNERHLGEFEGGLKEISKNSDVCDRCVSRIRIGEFSAKRVKRK